MLNILNNYFLRSHLELEWSISQLVWTFCFSLILVVSILGNSIVLWIILGTRPAVCVYLDLDYLDSREHFLGEN